MCTEEGRLRTIGVALSFKVRNSRSWRKLEPADFRNGVRLLTSGQIVIVYRKDDEDDRDHRN